MMSSDDVDEEVVPWAVSTVEIYENERFWVGGGFSKMGLLPTDRRPFSTDDGSLSWKKVELASKVMLEKGWAYIDEEFAPDNKDSDGWKYAPDFSPESLQASTERRRTLSDFVRRRKLVRKKKFDPGQFLDKQVYSKCDYCDSTVMDVLSEKMLLALTHAAKLQQNNAQHVLTDAIAFPLKKKLIDSLGIGDPFPGDFPESAADRVNYVCKALEEFPKKEQGVLSKAFHLFENDIDEEAQKRLISRKYFSQAEREAISGLLIRCLDTSYELHCDKELCGDLCEFCVVECPNSGCTRKISRKHLAAHDLVCDYKVVACPKACGDSFPRNKQEIHLKQICPEREVLCPFAHIGCTAIILAKATEEHMIANSNGHLLMAMGRMIEYESFMSKMNSRIKTLEAENEELKKKVEANQIAMVKDVASNTTSLTSLTKKVTNLESSCKSEFKKNRRAHAK